jgi:short-subunit dehydrogenase
MKLTSPQRVLITGASRGIGRATALACAQAGMDLALLARTPEELETVAAAARDFGVQAYSYALDLTQLAQVQEQVGKIAKELEINVLINNAGMGYTGNLLETPLADWQQVLNLNLTSAFLCCQAVLPQMRDQQRGTIVNVVSIGGRQVFPGWGAYCVSKFGLLALSKTLAAEERSHGIRVVSLCPGSVNTSIWDTETVQADFDRTAMLTPETVAASILHTLLLPEQAVVEELVLMPGGGAF